jgi:tRNA (guanine-N7-)-methyltransferase
MTRDFVVHEAPRTLRPGLRTFKPRRSRVTTRQSRALEHDDGLLLVLQDLPLDPQKEWGMSAPLMLEIGFGDGSATALIAAAAPDVSFLAVDIHTPGVGDLLQRLRDAHVTNVRVMEADALLVLERMVAPGSLTEVRSLFPDPWPKARHHKRRLIQPAVLDLVRDRLVPGGTWHVATDWPEYAEAIMECFAMDQLWTGGSVPRPDWRVTTRYEQRAQLEGRASIDLTYRTVDPKTKGI